MGAGGSPTLAYQWRRNGTNLPAASGTSYAIAHTTSNDTADYTVVVSNAYGSAFYLTTGFHGLHVTGGLVAFLFVLATTYVAKRFTHDQATRAIVTSYYWHFVDVVWIALFFMIYILK